MVENSAATDPIVYVIDDDDSARHSLEFLLDVAGIKVRSFPSADAFLSSSPPLNAIRNALAQRSGEERAAAERREVADRIATLSGREHEVMEGLIAGKANKAIAFDLEISARTVEVYRANVMTKMQARTLSDLVRMVTIARMG